MNVVKTIIHPLLFLVGLLAAAAGIRHLDALPFWDYCRHKTTHLSRTLDDYDTLFVGSSRFHRSLIPEEFDARMRALGQESQSFNMALRGLRMHDFQPLLEWVIEQQPKKLKRIFVELYTYDQYLRDGSWMTGTQIEVHTPATLLSRLASNAMSHHEFGERMAIHGHIVAHTLVNTFRIGQAGRITRDCFRRAMGAKLSPGTPVEHGGFAELALGSVDKHRAKQHREWLENPAAANKLLAAKRDNLCPEWMVGGFNIDAFRAQLAQIEATGIEVVYVVMPQISFGFYGRDGVPEAAKLATVLLLDSPSDDPDLYDLKLWFDSNHMIRSGANLVSRRIAEKYAASQAVETTPK